MLIGLSSCKKEGCTDPDATNYSESAKKDDCTCNYLADVAFWFSENTADNIQPLVFDDGFNDHIKINIDANSYGTIDLSNFDSSTPTIEELTTINGSYISGFSMGKNKVDESKYQIFYTNTEGVEVEFQTGTINWSATDTPIIEIIY